MTTPITNIQQLHYSFYQESTPRFQRKSSNDANLLIRKSSISSGTSEKSLRMSYIHSSKISNMEKELFSSNIGQSLETCKLRKDETEKEMTKGKEATEKIWSEEEEKLKRLITNLKDQNHELWLKLESVNNILQEHIKKEGKQANKMRESIQKERMRELEIENIELKKQIEELKEEIEDARSNKNTEETLNSVNEYENICSFNYIEEHLNSEKEIFALNETIRTLHIEINSLKRRNHSDIEILKNSNEKECKTTKEKLIEMVKDNAKAYFL